MSLFSRSCCLWAINSSGFLPINFKNLLKFSSYSLFVASPLMVSSSFQYWRAGEVMFCVPELMFCVAFLWAGVLVVTRLLLSVAFG
jgi:hypothetical protein